MRKRRTKIATYLLTLGLVLGQTAGTGASVYAAETSGNETTEIVGEARSDGSEETGEDVKTLGSDARYAASQTEDLDPSEETDTEITGDFDPVDSYETGTDELISGTENEEEDSSEEEGSESTSESVSGDEKVDSSEEDGTDSFDVPEMTEEEEETADTEAVEEETADTEAVEEESADSLKEAPLRMAAAVAANGWEEQEDGSWKYYEDGSLVTGWKQIRNKWYFFLSDGTMATGWREIGDVKYYFLRYDNPVGSMVTGWKQIDGSWYFFKASGAMVTGWYTVSKEQYYFGSNGIMQTSQWIGDLYLRSDGTATDESFSREYMGSDYYKRLQSTLAELDEEGVTDIMQRTLRIAQSQEGYKNYALWASASTAETARTDGYLWNGVELRSNSAGTGNTEYTRWMQRYVKREAIERQYDDMQWCAIFSSWSMYQAGYYSGSDKRRWYYSTCADPRVEKSAITTSFNLDQAQVWYTPLATRKIAAYSGWNHYVHTEVDPYEIPYRPGGLIFFCWEGDGVMFDHVGIVVDYDEDRHVLNYISGNCSGKVKTYPVYYDSNTSGGFPYSQTIMAYAEYYTDRECWASEDDGLCYHQNGKRLTGWQKIDGRQYYFNEDGVLQIGWFRTDGHWYFSNSAGVLCTDGWKEDNGKLYYLNSKGIMLNGWHTIDGVQYCFAPGGFLYTDGWWKGYEFDENGAYTGNGKYAWHRNNIGWWYGNASGYAKNEMLMIDGKEYKFDGNGYWVDQNKEDKDGWMITGDKYYYILKNGTRAKGWKWVNGYYYYFDPETGLMRCDGWWDNYKLEENGTWVYKYKGRWRKNYKGWWYEDTSGWCPKDMTVNIEGVAYQFDEAGYLIED